MYILTYEIKDHWSKEDDCFIWRNNFEKFETVEQVTDYITYTLGGNLCRKFVLWKTSDSIRLDFETRYYVKTDL